METAQIISRDDVMREWRDSLIEQMGSEVLADAHIRFAREEADKMRARHSDLRAELRVLDMDLSVHLQETREVLAPLREAADRLRAEADAAYTRLETMRIAREANRETTLRNRMSEIREELARPYSPIGPTASNWKHGPKLDANTQRSN
jgi:uncharacterized coiled-coil DUF342 family protein